MDAAYQPQAWHDLYLMIGGAAAGLTGLIFVAVSLHLREILGNRWHRGTAGSSLLALMSVVLISGVLLAPPQPLPLAGLEITAIAAASPIYSCLALAHLPMAQRRAEVAQLFVGIIAGLTAAGAGVSIAVGAGGGLWLLLPAAVVALVTSVMNAWRLMVDVAETTP
jgi:modulator of FtsH protease